VCVCLVVRSQCHTSGDALSPLPLCLPHILLLLHACVASALPPLLQHTYNLYTLTHTCLWCGVLIHTERRLCTHPPPSPAAAVWTYSWRRSLPLCRGSSICATTYSREEAQRSTERSTPPPLCHTCWRYASSSRVAAPARAVGSATSCVPLLSPRLPVSSDGSGQCATGGARASSPGRHQHTSNRHRHSSSIVCNHLPRHQGRCAAMSLAFPSVVSVVWSAAHTRTERSDAAVHL